MVATFTHYEEFPGVGAEAARQACLAVHLALDGLLRDWIAQVNRQDPLRPLEIVEGPGQEEGRTGWTIQATDPNADPQGRVHIWMILHTTLEPLTTLMGPSRVRTENPGAYSTFEAMGADGAISSSSFSLAFGFPFALTVTASDEPGKEYFCATIAQGNLVSRIHSLAIVREQNYGGWLLMPSFPSSLRAMGREGVPPFDARPVLPVLPRVVLNHLETPALVMISPAAAAVGLEVRPPYRLPDDFALCDGHLNPNYLLRFADGSVWLTAARGFAVKLEEAS